MIQEFLLDEMATVVKEEEKTTEWHELVEKLGLEGQKDVCGSSEEAHPVPFPIMNLGMTHVYEELCPTKVKVQSYNKTAIPLRVLALIGLCHEKQYFEEIEIWSDETDPDPVVIGHLNKEKYLIARWGDELEEYALLAKKAIARRIEKRTNVMREKIADGEHALKTVVEDVTKYMTGGSSWLWDN